ncbi:hypothetical protein ACFE04_004643 [Oxalis oulophora]
MENGYLKDDEFVDHLQEIDPWKPAALTWQRQLNSNQKLPLRFSFTLRDVMHLGPIGIRVWYHSRQDVAKGKPVIFDVSKKHLITSDHGVPLGGIGAGSIGRSYRGEFQHFKILPRICEEAPVLANQFSVFVSRPNGEKVSTVLCPRSSGVGRGRKDSSIGSWDWNLNGEKCTYHALFPRAWTVYDGVPDPDIKIISRQISPFIPNNYKESSYPVSVFTFTVSNTGRTSADVTLLFTWANSIGGDSGFSGNHVNSKMMTKDGIKGVTLYHRTANGQPPVTFAIAAQETPDVHISECPWFLISGNAKGVSARDMWNEIKKHGSFDHIDSSQCQTSPSASRSSIGAAIAASVTIPSGSIRTVTFSLAWDSPEVRFSEKTYYRRYTKFYGTIGNAAAEIAHDAILEHTSWETQIDAWQRPILEDKRLPEW